MGELASQGENNKDLTPSAGLPWLKRHDVQFYDDDQQLATSIGRYLAEGIRFAQPAIVIATPQHRRAFAAVMRTLGVDVEGLHDSQLVWLDARETLSAFMQGHRPDAELFEATVGNVFEKLIGTRHYVTVRAYGEMVDLLWRDGKQAAALELEALWNALANRYAFALRCAYDKHSFKHGPDADGMARISAIHSHVVD
jgi:hypothetical protein